jgi:hypothetical protein
MWKKEPAEVHGGEIQGAADTRADGNRTWFRTTMFDRGTGLRSRIAVLYRQIATRKVMLLAT